MSGEKYMKRALGLAQKGAGYVSPNPLVGAVIVKNGKVIGMGYHQKYGKEHAEVNAISQAGKDARGADLYVTLEPCNHYGRQPPCTKAIISAGIGKVYAAIEDPNSGSQHGAQELEAHSIPVEFGLCAKEAQEQNEVFIKNCTEKMPFVAIKIAMTRDGFISWGNGKKKKVTGKEAHEFVQQLRKKYDGILVGINTVLKDNPGLTYRADEKLSPVRIVLDPHAKTPADAKILKEPGRTIIAVSQKAAEKKVSALVKRGATILRAKEKRGKILLGPLLRELFSLGICSVLVEGGAATNTIFAKEDLYDKVYMFVSPKKVGKGLPALAGGIKISGRALQIERLGKDTLTIIRKVD